MVNENGNGNENGRTKGKGNKDKNKKTLQLILLLIGFIGAFITTIIWWSRIHPWFSHGKSNGKSVYQGLLACWILSLIGAAFTAFLLISNLCLENICNDILSKFYVIMIVLALEFGLSIGVIISGLYLSTYALKNPKYGDEPNDNRCLKYISGGFTGASLWAIQNNKINDYVKWSTDLAKNSQNDDGTYNGYLCVNVGAPTLTFVIVLFIALVFSIIEVWKMPLPSKYDQ